MDLPLLFWSRAMGLSPRAAQSQQGKRARYVRSRWTRWLQRRSLGQGELRYKHGRGETIDHNLEARAKSTAKGARGLCRGFPGIPRAFHVLMEAYPAFSK